MNENELMHYGVLGMKWGVRRFQNADGSYTKKGLERYRKTERKYNSAKERLSTARKAKDSSAKKLAKRDVKTQKAQLKKDYKKLKGDYRADQGKALYQKGKTITLNQSKLKLSETLVIAGSGIVSGIIAQNGKTKTATIAASSIAIGGTAVNAILYGKTASENKKMRAYLYHNR